MSLQVFILIPPRVSPKQNGKWVLHKGNDGTYAQKISGGHTFKSLCHSHVTIHIIHFSSSYLFLSSLCIEPFDIIIL